MRLPEGPDPILFISTPKHTNSAVVKEQKELNLSSGQPYL